MPRFELKISWTRGLSAAVVLSLCGLIATACLCCHDRPHQEKPLAPLNAAPLAAEAAAPPFVSGLPADFKDKAREVFREYPQPFRIGGNRDELRQKSVFLWEAVLQQESPRKPRGQHYTAGPQLIGSCVAWGGATAVYYTLSNAVVAGNAGGVDDPCQPISYGITRVTQGKGRPRCGQDGAYPSDFAKGVANFGWATWSESQLTYSAALESRLGCSGPTAEQLALAKARAGVDCYPIRTVDELLEALHNGYAGTAGIDWTPGRTRNENGRIVTDFNGGYRGGHQIAWVGWDAERQHLIYHNSHGPNAHPRNEGDPPGSFRVTLSTLESQLRNGEFWAFSSVPGFPAQEIDLTPLRPKKRTATQTKEVSHVDPHRDRNVFRHGPEPLPRLFDADGRRLPDAGHLCERCFGGTGPDSHVRPAFDAGGRNRRLRPVGPVFAAGDHVRRPRGRPVSPAVAAA